MRALSEQSSLRLSMYCAAVISVLGVVMGVLAKSQIVLFDGMYSFIGVVLAWLSLYAARIMQAGETPRYPFGREALGPLIVGIQGLVLLGTLGYATLDAVLTILAGGGHTELGAALGYALVTLATCIVLVIVLRRSQDDSELVAAEATQWAAGGALSLAMVIGFTVAILIDLTAWAQLSAFVDPALVLVSAVILVPAPIKMIRATMKDLLEAAPGPEYQQEVAAAVAEVRRRYGLPEPTLRLGKMGRKLYVELDFVVGDQPWGVADVDRLRRDLTARLAPLTTTLWLNVEMHTDPAWDR